MGDLSEALSSDRDVNCGSAISDLSPAEAPAGCGTNTASIVSIESAPASSLACSVSFEKISSFPALMEA